MKNISLILILVIVTFLSSCVAPNKESYQYNDVAYVTTYKSDGKTMLVMYPKNGIVYINNLTDEIKFVDNNGKDISLNGSYSVSFE